MRPLEGLGGRRPVRPFEGPFLKTRPRGVEIGLRPLGGTHPIEPPLPAETPAGAARSAIDRARAAGTWPEPSPASGPLDRPAIKPVRRSRAPSGTADRRRLGGSGPSRGPETLAASGPLGTLVRSKGRPRASGAIEPLAGGRPIGPARPLVERGVRSGRAAAAGPQIRGGIAPGRPGARSAVEIAGRRARPGSARPQAGVGGRAVQPARPIAPVGPIRAGRFVQPRRAVRTIEAIGPVRP